MNGNFRTSLIKLLTFVGGIYFFLEFILPESELARAGLTSKVHDKITLGFMAIGLAAFGLGLINLFLTHGTKIAFRRKGWTDSLALLLGLVIMLSVTLSSWRGELRVVNDSAEIGVLGDFAARIQKDSDEKTAGVPELSFRKTRLKQAAEDMLAKDAPARVFDPGYTPDSAADKAYRIAKLDFDAKYAEVSSQVEKFDTGANTSGLAELSKSLTELASRKRAMLRIVDEHSLSKNLFKFLFNAVFVSLGSAMFSLLGVYIAAAAYRAFRIKTVESSLMMLAAVIVMLGQIPFGLWIYHGLPEWRSWLLQIPNSAAFRAIKIGAGVAGLVMAFRMWFSIESDSFAEDR